MKSFYICVVAVCLFVVNCYARCDCDTSDNICISKCVVEANSCVTSCKRNIECYENCIDDKWPSADASEEEVEATLRFNDVLATTTVSYMMTATNSVSAPFSRSNSAKQAEASNSHVSLGSTIKFSGMVPILVVAILYVLI